MLRGWFRVGDVNNGPGQVRDDPKSQDGSDFPPTTRRVGRVEWRPFWFDLRFLTHITLRFYRRLADHSDRLDDSMAWC